MPDISSRAEVLAGSLLPGGWKVWGPADGRWKAGHCAAVAHQLAHDGHEAVVWRAWLNLAAQAYEAAGSPWMALPLSVIVRPGAKPASSPGPTPRPERRALGAAVGLDFAPPPVPSAETLELVDQGLVDLLATDQLGLLVAALHSGDLPAAARALDALAKPNAGRGTFHAEVYPLYEPVYTALAALAMCRGLRVADLSEASRRWYWPAVGRFPNPR